MRDKLLDLLQGALICSIAVYEWIRPDGNKVYTPRQIAKRIKKTGERVVLDRT